MKFGFRPHSLTTKEVVRSQASDAPPTGAEVFRSQERWVGSFVQRARPTSFAPVRGPGDGTGVWIASIQEEGRTCDSDDVT